MLDERVLKAMASMRGRIEPEYRARLREIISLCEEYRAYAGNFSFRIDAELERSVNVALVALSDAILAAIRRRLQELLDELEESEYADAAWNEADADEEGISPIVRIDKYCSDLKARLQGFIAVGFALGLPADRIIAEMETYDEPQMSPLWKRAADEEKIDEGTLIPLVTRKVGRGRLKGLLEGVAAIGAYMIAKGYHGLNIKTLYPLATQGGMACVGYRVHRGSTYDCPQCDELCVGIHPLTEVVLPAHPHCCCWTTKVFMDSEGRYVDET